MSFKVTEDYIKSLRQVLESKNSGLKGLLVELHAADIAEILTYFSIDEVLQLFAALPKENLSGI